MFNICLVEDEPSLCKLMSAYLEKEEYNVICTSKGSEAVKIFKSKKIDLWILDIMLEDDISGYDIIKSIRETDNIVPVIFTSARDQELDKIIGLELDADDYITKPYSPKELILRVNKIIKRTYKQEFSKIKYEDYIINKDKRVVLENEKEISLTTLEFDLLILFLSNLKRTFSREDILGLVWGRDYYGSERVVDDLVRRLRSKMPKLNIETVYGYGYRMN